MKGFGESAKPKKGLNYELNKRKYQGIVNEGFKHHSEGNISEAKKHYQYLVEKGFQNAKVFNNYGVILKDLEQYQEAEVCFRKSIQINPKYAFAYSNLASILRKLGCLKEAEISIRKAIELSPNLEKAYSKLALILIADNKLEEAKLSAFKAIKLNPRDGDAHLSLGIVLRDLGELKAAELSIKKSIEIDPNVAICYQNLSLLNYAKGNIDEAIKNIEKANNIDPVALDNKLLLKILNKRKYMIINDSNDQEDTESCNEKSIDEPIILYRKVDQNLVESLYKLKSRDLNRFSDPSFGNARGSDYLLFQDNEQVTDYLKKDLVSITKKVINSDVFFRDSFFTILEGDSIITKHNHIGSIDKFPSLNLWKQKYSLVYYLSIGDQDCKYPGSLKFYEGKNSSKSKSEILPKEGMIIIFPADRYHSVKYDGNKDRIIIGVNFYSI